MRRMWRGVALLTCVMFLQTSLFSSSPAQAAPIAPAAVPVVPLSFDSLQIPAEIGKVDDTFTGTSDFKVIVVQDAHAIPNAQRSIRKAILYFHQKYGVNLVALEGASAKLDARMLKSFPDKERLNRVLGEYFDQGELAGGTAAAIAGIKAEDNSAAGSRMIFQGVEDWPVYEEALGLYLAAMGKEKNVLEAVKSQKSKVESQKKENYSPELLKIDQAISAFRGNSSDFMKTLEVLAAVKVPEKGSELELLLQEAKSEGADQTGAEVEVRRIAEKIKKLEVGSSPPKDGSALNVAEKLEDKKEFNQKYQAFQTGQLSAKAFSLFLREFLAASPALYSRLPPEERGRAGKTDDSRHRGDGGQARLLASLTRLSGSEKRMRDIEGTKLFTDFELYTQSVKESLFKTEQDRELDREDRKLWLLTKLAKLELSYEDWTEIAASAFGLLAMTKQETVMSSPHVSGGDLNPLSLRSAAGGEAISELFRPHFAFYRNAQKRDEIFYTNLQKLLKANERRATSDDLRHTALLVAGGFHAHGLCSLLKKHGISYALVMPEIKNLPEQSNYRQHMQGNVSWKNYFEVENGKVNLYNAFIRGTRDRLIGASRESWVVSHEKDQSNSPRPTPQDPRLLKTWRDQIIRDLADEGRIEKAGEYTRFIDELTGGGRDQAIQKRLKQVEQFLEGLKRLDVEGKFSAPNIAKLFPAATVQDGASSVTSLVAGPRSEIRASVLGLTPIAQEVFPDTAKSEVRTTEQDTRGTGTLDGASSGGLPSSLLLESFEKWAPGQRQAFYDAFIVAINVALGKITRAAQSQSTVHTEPVYDATVFLSKILSMGLSDNLDRFFGLPEYSLDLFMGRQMPELKTAIVDTGVAGKEDAKIGTVYVFGEPVVRISLEAGAADFRRENLLAGTDDGRASFGIILEKMLFNIQSLDWMQEIIRNSVRSEVRQKERILSRDEIAELVTSTIEPETSTKGRVVWIHRTGLSEEDVRKSIFGEGLKFGKRGLVSTASLMPEDPVKAMSPDNNGYEHRFRKEKEGTGGIVLILEFPRDKLEAEKPSVPIISHGRETGQMTPGNLTDQMSNRISNFLRSLPQNSLEAPRVIPTEFIRGYIVRETNRFVPNPGFRSEVRQMPEQADRPSVLSSTKSEMRALYQNLDELNRDVAALERQLEPRIAELPRIGFHGEPAGRQPTGDFYYFVSDPNLKDYWRSEWQGAKAYDARFRLGDKKDALSLKDVFMKAPDFFAHLFGTVLFTSDYGGLRMSEGKLAEIYLLKQVSGQGFDLDDQRADKKDATVFIYDPTKGSTNYPFFFVEGNLPAINLPAEAVVAKVGLLSTEVQAIATWAGKQKQIRSDDANGRAMFSRYFAVRLLYKKILEELMNMSGAAVEAPAVDGTLTLLGGGTSFSAPGPGRSEVRNTRVSDVEFLNINEQETPLSLSSLRQYLKRTDARGESLLKAKIGGEETIFRNVGVSEIAMVFRADNGFVLKLAIDPKRNEDIEYEAWISDLISERASEAGVQRPAAMQVESQGIVDVLGDGQSRVGLYFILTPALSNSRDYKERFSSDPSPSDIYQRLLLFLKYLQAVNQLRKLDIIAKDLKGANLRVNEIDSQMIDLRSFVDVRDGDDAAGFIEEGSAYSQFNTPGYYPLTEIDELLILYHKGRLSAKDFFAFIPLIELQRVFIRDVFQDESLSEESLSFSGAGIGPKAEKAFQELQPLDRQEALRLVKAVAADSQELKKSERSIEDRFNAFETLLKRLVELTAAGDGGVSQSAGPSNQARSEVRQTPQQADRTAVQRTAMGEVRTALKDELTRVQTILLDSAFAEETAKQLHQVYLSGTGFDQPLFSDKDRVQLSTVTQDEVWTSMNLAGFYALIDGMDAIRMLRASAGESLDYHAILELILNGKLQENEQRLLKRFANLTWKLSRTYRKSGEEETIWNAVIKHADFKAWDDLSPAVQQKDLDQIRWAAEKLLPKLDELARAGKSEQDALNTLLQDELFARDMARHVQDSYDSAYQAEVRPAPGRINAGLTQYDLALIKNLAGLYALFETGLFLIREWTGSKDSLDKTLENIATGEITPVEKNILMQLAHAAWMSVRPIAPNGDESFQDRLSKLKPWSLGSVEDQRLDWLQIQTAANILWQKFRSEMRSNEAATSSTGTEVVQTPLAKALRGNDTLAGENVIRSEVRSNRSDAVSNAAESLPLNAELMDQVEGLYYSYSNFDSAAEQERIAPLVRGYVYLWALSKKIGAASSLTLSQQQIGEIDEVQNRIFETLLKEAGIFILIYVEFGTPEIYVQKLKSQSQAMEGPIQGRNQRAIYLDAVLDDDFPLNAQGVHDPIHDAAVTYGPSIRNTRDTFVKPLFAGVVKGLEARVIADRRASDKVQAQLKRLAGVLQTALQYAFPEGQRSDNQIFERSLRVLTIHELGHAMDAQRPDDFYKKIKAKNQRELSAILQELAGAGEPVLSLLFMAGTSVGLATSYDKDIVQTLDALYEVGIRAGLISQKGQAEKLQDLSEAYELYLETLVDRVAALLALTPSQVSDLATEAYKDIFGFPLSLNDLSNLKPVAGDWSDSARQTAIQRASQFYTEAVAKAGGSRSEVRSREEILAAGDVNISTILRESVKTWREFGQTMQFELELPEQDLWVYDQVIQPETGGTFRPWQKNREAVRAYAETLKMALSEVYTNAAQGRDFRGASKITIRALLDKSTDRLVIELADDGPGIDEEIETALNSGQIASDKGGQHGQGVRFIRSYLAQLGGTVSIITKRAEESKKESKNVHGTTVRIEIPTPIKSAGRSEVRSSSFPDPWERGYAELTALKRTFDAFLEDAKAPESKIPANPLTQLAMALAATQVYGAESTLDWVDFMQESIVTANDQIHFLERALAVYDEPAKRWLQALKQAWSDLAPKVEALKTARSEVRQSDEVSAVLSRSEERFFEFKEKIKTMIRVLDNWEHRTYEAEYQRIENELANDETVQSQLIQEYFDPQLGVDTQEILRLIVFTESGLTKLVRDSRFQSVPRKDLITAYLWNQAIYALNNETEKLFKGFGTIRAEAMEIARQRGQAEADRFELLENLDFVPAFQVTDVYRAVQKKITLSALIAAFQRAGMDISGEEISQSLSETGFERVGSDEIRLSIDLANSTFRGSLEEDNPFAQSTTRHPIEAFRYGLAGGETAKNYYKFKGLSPNTMRRAVHEYDFSLILERVEQNKIEWHRDDIVAFATSFGPPTDSNHQPLRGLKKRTLLIEAEVKGQPKNFVEILRVLVAQQKKERELKGEILNRIKEFRQQWPSGEERGNSWIFKYLEPFKRSLKLNIERLKSESGLSEEYVMEYFFDGSNLHDLDFLMARLEREQSRSEQFSRRAEIGRMAQQANRLSALSTAKSEMRSRDQTLDMSDAVKSQYLKVLEKRGFLPEQAELILGASQAMIERVLPAQTTLEQKTAELARTLNNFRRFTVFQSVLAGLYEQLYVLAVMIGMLLGLNISAVGISLLQPGLFLTEISFLIDVAEMVGVGAGLFALALPILAGLSARNVLKQRDGILNDGRRTAGLALHQPGRILLSDELLGGSSRTEIVSTVSHEIAHNYFNRGHVWEAWGVLRRLEDMAEEDRKDVYFGMSTAENFKGLEVAMRERAHLPRPNFLNRFLSESEEAGSYDYGRSLAGFLYGYTQGHFDEAYSILRLVGQGRRIHDAAAAVYGKEKSIRKFQQWVNPLSPSAEVETPKADPGMERSEMRQTGQQPVSAAVQRPAMGEMRQTGQQGDHEPEMVEIQHFTASDIKELIQQEANAFSDYVDSGQHLLTRRDNAEKLASRIVIKWSRAYWLGIVMDIIFAIFGSAARTAERKKRIVIERGLLLDPSALRAELSAQWMRQNPEMEGFANVTRILRGIELGVFQGETADGLLEKLESAPLPAYARQAFQAVQAVLAEDDWQKQPDANSLTAWGTELDQALPAGLTDTERQLAVAVIAIALGEKFKDSIAGSNFDSPVWHFLRQSVELKTVSLSEVYQAIRVSAEVRADLWQSEELGLDAGSVQNLAEGWNRLLAEKKEFSALWPQGQDSKNERNTKLNRYLQLAVQTYNDDSTSQTVKQNVLDFMMFVLLDEDFAVRRRVIELMMTSVGLGNSSLKLKLKHDDNTFNFFEQHLREPGISVDPSGSSFQAPEGLNQGRSFRNKRLALLIYFAGETGGVLSSNPQLLEWLKNKFDEDQEVFQQPEPLVEIGGIPQFRSLEAVTPVSLVELWRNVQIELAVVYRSVLMRGVDSDKPYAFLLTQMNHVMNQWTEPLSVGRTTLYPPAQFVRMRLSLLGSTGKILKAHGAAEYRKFLILQLERAENNNASVAERLLAITFLAQPEILNDVGIEGRDRIQEAKATLGGLYEQQAPYQPVSFPPLFGSVGVKTTAKSEVRTTEHDTLGTGILDAASADPKIILAEIHARKAGVRKLYRQGLQAMAQKAASEVRNLESGYVEMFQKAYSAIRDEEEFIADSGTDISALLLAETDKITAREVEGYVFRRPKSLSAEDAANAPIMWRVSLNVKSNPSLIGALDAMMSDQNTPDTFRGSYKIVKDFLQTQKRKKTAIVYILFDPADKDLSAKEQKPVRQKEKARITDILKKNLFEAGHFRKSARLSEGEIILDGGAAFVLEPVQADMDYELTRAWFLDAQLGNSHSELQGAIRTYLTRKKIKGAKMEASAGNLIAVQNVLSELESRVWPLFGTAAAFKDDLETKIRRSLAEMSLDTSEIVPTSKKSASIDVPLIPELTLGMGITVTAADDSVAVVLGDGQTSFIRLVIPRGDIQNASISLTPSFAVLVDKDGLHLNTDVIGKIQQAFLDQIQRSLPAAKSEVRQLPEITIANDLNSLIAKHAKKGPEVVTELVGKYGERLADWALSLDSKSPVVGVRELLRRDPTQKIKTAIEQVTLDPETYAEEAVRDLNRMIRDEAYFGEWSGTVTSLARTNRNEADWMVAELYLKIWVIMAKRFPSTVMDEEHFRAGVVETIGLTHLGVDGSEAYGAGTFYLGIDNFRSARKNRVDRIIFLAAHEKGHRIEVKYNKAAVQSVHDHVQISEVLAELAAMAFYQAIEAKDVLPVTLQDRYKVDQVSPIMHRGVQALKDSGIIPMYANEIPKELDLIRLFEEALDLSKDSPDSPDKEKISLRQFLERLSKTPAGSASLSMGRRLFLGEAQEGVKPLGETVPSVEDTNGVFDKFKAIEILGVDEGGVSGRRSELRDTVLAPKIIVTATQADIEEALAATGKNLGEFVVSGELPLDMIQGIAREVEKVRREKGASVEKIAEVIRSEVRAYIDQFRAGAVSINQLGEVDELVDRLTKVLAAVFQNRPEGGVTIAVSVSPQEGADRVAAIVRTVASLAGAGALAQVVVTGDQDGRQRTLGEMRRQGLTGVRTASVSDLDHGLAAFLVSQMVLPTAHGEDELIHISDSVLGLGLGADLKTILSPADLALLQIAQTFVQLTVAVLLAAEVDSPSKLVTPDILKASVLEKMLGAEALKLETVQGLIQIDSNGRLNISQRGVLGLLQTITDEIKARAEVRQAA